MDLIMVMIVASTAILFLYLVWDTKDPVEALRQTAEDLKSTLEGLKILKEQVEEVHAEIKKVIPAKDAENQEKDDK